jgi:hypothetical protein
METYHKILRTLGVVVALVLLFDSGVLNETTKDLSRATQLHIATVVGVSASVQENEYNAFTAAITERQRELDAREAALAAREIDARARDTTPFDSEVSTYILSVILFVLLVLIVLNYVLDWVRARREVRYT